MPGNMPTLQTSTERQAELRSLRRTDPVKLLAIYRQIADLDALAKMPQGVSFAALINSIVHSEINSGKLAK